MKKTRGVLVLVTGPSGAGKDTLIEGVRAELAVEHGLNFARRVITRPADAGGEDHIPSTAQAFQQLKAEGAFWSDWRAHGLDYGLPIELREMLQSGTSVLANVSRSVTTTLAALWDATVVIEINAPAALTRERLKQRGRETSNDIEQRVARTAKDPADFVRRIKVNNNASVEEGITRFRDAVFSALELQHGNLEAVTAKSAISAYKLDDQIGFLLRRAHQYASSIFQDHMSSLALTPPQFAAMATIHRHGTVSQNKLGRMIDTDPATMQGIIKRLADREYVARRPDQEHKRKINLTLTESGRQLIETAIETAWLVSRDTLTSLDPDEQNQLIGLLSKLVNVSQTD